MSVFKLCGRPLRGYLLTPQTSALGMRDGAGNVPEPPAPARWASRAHVDGPLRHGTERGARCRKAGRADRRRPRNSPRAFPSHDLSPPGTKRGPGGLKSETPLPLLDEALLSLPKFFSIKRSHRQRHVCAGPASRPATRLPPAPTSASRNRLRAGSAARLRPASRCEHLVLRGGRRPCRRAPSMFPSSRAGHPGGPACLSAFTPHAHGLCTESESRPRMGVRRRRSPRARLQRSPRHYWGSHSL